MTRTQLAVILVLAIVGARLADEPIAGWDHARWGMSNSDIQTAYPHAKAAKRNEYNFGGRRYYSELELPGTRVGRYDFTVRFLMDDSAMLAAVQLAKDFAKDIADCEPAFDTIKQLLIQKYGPPTTEEHPTGEH